LDWAGTTLDYGCYAPAVVFIEVYKRKGVEITMEEAREPMGAHKKDHIRKISQIPAVAKRWQQVHSRICTEDDVEAMFQDFIPL
jgi:phosphonoacetaldehyde hydrolase